MIRRRRGFIPIQYAIIGIAMIVIAAALSFVIINQGMFSSQRSQETMARGLQEASSSLQISGSVLAITDANGVVKYLMIPVKVTAGRQPVDISNSTLVVSMYISGESPLVNIYKGFVHGVDTHQNLTDIVNAIWASDPSKAEGIFIANNDDNNTVLNYYEEGFLVVDLGNQPGNVGGVYRGEQYDTVKVEIKPIVGGPLVITRTLPGGMPVSDIVDLG